jgi:hypothetical protein
MNQENIKPIQGTNQLLEINKNHPEFVGYMLLLNYIQTGSIDIKQNTSQPRGNQDG